MKPQRICSTLYTIACMVIVSIVISFTAQAQWKQCNGPLGGTVLSMAQSGTSLLSAIANHGIFRSVDKGEHWTQTVLGDGIDVNRLTAVGNSTVYACSDSGLYRSQDNGATWTLLLKSKKNEIFRAFTTKGTMLFAGSEGVGVYRSTDDGTTWKETNLGLHSINITSLATIDSFVFVGTYGKGVYRSPDNGDGWWPLYVNVPDPNFMNFIRFHVLEQDSVIFCSTNYGMQRSKDLGNTWEECDTGRINKYVSYLQTINSAIYTLTGKYVYKSINHGDTWEQFNLKNLPVNVSSIVVSGTEQYIGSTESGIYKSTTGSADWQAVNTGINYQGISKLVTQGKIVYAGTYSSGIYKSEDNGANWTHLGLHSQGIETLCIHDSIILASTQQAMYRSTDGGRTWQDTIKTRFYVSQIFYVDTVVFAGALRVNPSSGVFRPIYRSLDDGATWEEVPFELEGTILYAFTAVGTTLFAAGNGVYRSTDFGATWQETDTIMKRKYIVDLCAVGSSLLNAIAGEGVFRSDDLGKSWVKADYGLMPEYSYPICSDGFTIYLGNYDKGIFKSVNKGETWTDANAGLTNKSINTLCFAGRSLFLGSSKGVWKLDNATDVLEDKFQSKVNQSLALFPNPASSEITIDCSAFPSFSAANPIHYSVTSLTGEILMEFERKESRFSISTDTLSNGIYYIIARQGLIRTSTLCTIMK
ncbi:MAG: hypothetical protein IPM69_00530 [Ignavibacteria bacterium]|nr:hypothetical protein [Ignavibacteria bacterium]